MISKSVENYLKTIFLLSEKGNMVVTTNSIAEKLQTRASSVTDMIKKLTVKKLLTYKKYKGVSLTKKGERLATSIVRKHRLWETFLVDKLHFNWEEVHDIAEQLEHIKSDKLVSSLDDFLGHPQFDPHGDPIPNSDGKFPKLNSISLHELSKGEEGIVMGVLQDSPAFLQFLNKVDIKLGNLISIKDIIEFDGSMEIEINKQEYHISFEVAKNILIKQK